MAVKKTAAKKAAPKKTAAPKKVVAKKTAAPKKVVAKKAAPASKAAPATKTAVAKKAAPKKKPVVLSDGQKAVLAKVAAAKAGYTGAKAEGRTLVALQTKKLIKRGPKDKATGNYSYSISKTGTKCLTATPVLAPVK